MEVLCEVRNRTAHITLNRPDALNALSLNMVNQLRALCLGFARDPGVNALFIQGAGGKAFCAGGDIRALYTQHRASGRIDLEFFEREYPLDYLLRFYTKPYVALIDGIVMGGGMGISQGARWRIVGERTRMAMPEVGIGFFPDVGGSFFLSRLPGAIGTYLALTGNSIRAADALYAGLADLYLDAEGVERLPAALDAMDWLSAATHGDVLDAALRRLAAPPATAPLAALRSAIDAHFSLPDAAGILGSLEAERRPALSEWARQTVEVLRKRSPTLLAVTVDMLARGRELSFADCLRMEIGMVRQCYVQGDFFEGVRALVIDKDNTPRWQPARLEDVERSQVQAIFSDPWQAGAHPLADIEAVLESCS